MRKYMVGGSEKGVYCTGRTDSLVKRMPLSSSLECPCYDDMSSPYDEFCPQGFRDALREELIEFECQKVDLADAIESIEIRKYGN